MKSVGLTATLSIGAILLAFGVHEALAADVEIKMQNKSGSAVMVFEPNLVKIAPGDTVHFVVVDKGHNAESITGMMPEGAAPFAGKMNEEIAVKFDQPGVYGIKCKPHYGLGMVGLIVVGEPTNVDAAKAVKQTGKAKQIFAGLFERLSGSAAQ